jgi:hypothetical protein
VALTIGEKLRLVRLTGIADELLTSLRARPELSADGAAQAQVASLLEEVHALLGESAPALADEFEQVVVGAAAEDAPAELRAAAAAGWLKAGLASQSFDEQAAGPAETMLGPLRRKQTLGFKIRSPITRDAAPDAAEGEPESSA